MFDMSFEKQKDADNLNAVLNAADVWRGVNHLDLAVGKHVGQVTGYPTPNLEFVDKNNESGPGQKQQVAESYIQLSPTVGAWKYTKKEDGFDSIVFTGPGGEIIGHTKNGKPYPKA
jgi:hypothetical protein